MPVKNKKLGIYVSYNERLNGRFEDAVDIADTTGYLLWLDSSVIKPEKFDLPTRMFVRIKGQEKYFSGIIWAIKKSDSFDVREILADTIHRPELWQELDRENSEWHKSVLYVSHLKRILRPKEVMGVRPPQHPYYIELDEQV